MIAATPPPASDLADALSRIVQWADAYPPDVFPPPDADYLKRAAEVLAALKRLVGA